MLQTWEGRGLNRDLVKKGKGSLINKDEKSQPQQRPARDGVKGQKLDLIRTLD